MSVPARPEQVIRHRGGGRDENGELIPAVADEPLMAIGVAPGGSSGVPGGAQRIERARTGEDISCTVYFNPGTDLVNTDELTVRGQRFRIIVNEWLSDTPSLGGLEVRCTRGQG